MTNAISKQIANKQITIEGFMTFAAHTAVIYGRFEPKITDDGSIDYADLERDNFYCVSTSISPEIDSTDIVKLLQYTDESDFKVESGELTKIKALEHFQLIIEDEIKIEIGNILDMQ